MCADTKKPLTNPRKTLKSEASMKPKPSQKDIIGQTPLTVRRCALPLHSYTVPMCLQSFLCAGCRTLATLSCARLRVSAAPGVTRPPSGPRGSMFAWTAPTLMRNRSKLPPVAHHSRARSLICPSPPVRFQVQWPCCQQKNLPYRLMKPAHHTNVSVSPLDCQIMDEQ